MHVDYVRGALSPTLAAEVDAFAASAACPHYMQATGWHDVASHASDGGQLDVRYLLARASPHGPLRGVARLLRRRRGVLPSPSAVIERGPVVATLDDLTPVAAAMLRAARWHGVDRLRVQPYLAGDDSDRAARALEAAGFERSAAFTGPHTATLRIALAGVARADIFAGSERSDLRRHARKAREAGVVVRRGDARDLVQLATLYAQMMAGQGGSDHPPAYFAALGPLLAREQAALLVAEHDGALEASVVVCRHARQVTFHLGATSATRRPYKKMLLPLMAAAEWAHDVGAEVFDLGGVPRPEDDDPKRRAIAQFKFDFARTPVPITPVMFARPTAIGEAARWLAARARGLRRGG
jgi:hypothetical protein